MLDLPFDEHKPNIDARYIHCSRDKQRNILNDDRLCKHYYKDRGEVSHLQVLVSGQFLKVLLQSLQGTADKHVDISKMLQENRQK